MLYFLLRISQQTAYDAVLFNRTHGFCSFREQSGAVSSVIDEIYRLGKDCSGMPYGLFHALIEPFLFDGRAFSVARKVYFTDVVCIIH